MSEYLRRAESAGLSWPLPTDASDARLERLLFPPPPDLPASARGVPDFAEVHRQLKRKGVTLFLLWQEYRASCPDGYPYSWFCEHYASDGAIAELAAAAHANVVKYAQFPT